MTRSLARASWLVRLLLLIGRPASAQIVQALHLGGGGFIPKGYDSRAQGDVLVEDLNSLVFKISELSGGQAFGEWLIAPSAHIEIGAGVSYSSGGTRSIYADYTHPPSEGNREVEQELKLRMLPVTAVVRFLPFGKPSGVQPYVGIGITAVNYRYTESGEFIDFSDFTIFKNRYVATGTAVGPVFLAGVRFPIKGDVWGFTAEWRLQQATGDTGGAANGFLSDKIDLGGHVITAGLLVRF